MKLSKKVIIPVVAVLAAGAVGTAAVMVNNSKSVVPTVDVYEVVLEDLTNAISVTGVVESENSVNVYTTLSYPIETVHVKVGDVVAEGDVLAQLDTANLASNIAQSQASLSAAQAKTKHAVDVAEKDLQTFQFNTEENYNTTLIAAESAVKTAENAVRSADHKVNSTRKDLRDARDDKKQANDDESYDDMITEFQRASTQAQINLESAQLALEEAKESLRAAKMLNQEKEITTKDAVTSAKLNNNYSSDYISLEKMQKDMADATITAPISGTVTAVYAKEGAAGISHMFIIEDTKNLKVTTKIKEYDITSVSTNQPVIIKSDGTGSQEFQGTVAKIAPSSVRSDAEKAAGKTNDAEFVTEIKVASGSNLLIGMNARLSIITEQEKNAMSVPFEAIVTAPDGTSSVFVVDAQEDGTYLVRSVPVTTGMEGDFAIQVKGLTEGDQVVTTPETMVDGMQVLPVVNGVPQQAQQPQGGVRIMV